MSVPRTTFRIKLRCREGLLLCVLNKQPQLLHPPAHSHPVRIPIESGHPFQRKADSDSNRKRTPVPIESGQNFKFVTLL